MTYLESVGSFVDLQTGIVYPAFENSTPDLDNGVSLIEDIIPGDWLEALSPEDYSLVKKFVA